MPGPAALAAGLRRTSVESLRGFSRESSDGRTRSSSSLTAGDSCLSLSTTSGGDHGNQRLSPEPPLIPPWARQQRMSDDVGGPAHRADTHAPDVDSDEPEAGFGFDEEDEATSSEDEVSVVQSSSHAHTSCACLVGVGACTLFPLLLPSLSNSPAGVCILSTGRELDPTHACLTTHHLPVLLIYMVFAHGLLGVSRARWGVHEGHEHHAVHHV
jgi:hypothetical protein